MSAAALGWLLFVGTAERGASRVGLWLSQAMWVFPGNSPLFSGDIRQDTIKMSKPKKIQYANVSLILCIWP